jgi:hypothetical protein
MGFVQLAETGAAMAVHEKYRHLVQKKVKDRWGMGRWSGVVLEGKNYGLVMIAVQIAGTESATNARQAEILKSKGVLCSPRQQVYQDLRGLLAPYARDKNRVFTVVVGGDFNQTWQGKAGNVMETVKGLADSLKLENVMAEQHGETTGHTPLRLLEGRQL